MSVALVGVMLLSSCSLLNAFFGDRVDTAQVVRDTMAHIIEAINDQDAAALRALFTDYARAEYSAEIDEGVAQLLSLFPNGDVIWRDGGQPAGGGSGRNDHGKKTWLGGMGDIVSSAGKEYTLSFSTFTENTIDPQNVGVFRINVDARTENGVSGAELAGCETFDADARAGGPPGIFISDGGGLSADRAAQIVAAINARDAATLTGMFTEFARSKYATQVDEGVDHLISMFPRSDVELQQGTGGSAVCQRIEGDARTVLLPTFYTVSSGGVDYRLFFADFIENTIDPHNVGIFAIGAQLAAECGRCVPEAELNSWGTSFDLEATARPGVFVSVTHKADARMMQIAAALSTHDAAALKAMFASDALEQTSQMDDGLDYLLSIVPRGEGTWMQDPAVINPVSLFTYVEAGELMEWVQGEYRLSVGGHEYWLFFRDATVNEATPDAVGLESLGAMAWVEDRSSQMSGPPGEFYSWIHGGLYPGVYVP